MKQLSKVLLSSALVLSAVFIVHLPAQAERDDASQLIKIIAAIENGWEQADGTPFRKHFRDFEGARYIESGGQNSGLDDLIDHHVEPEGDALEGLDLTFSNIETHIEGDFAWAVADVEVSAVVKKGNRKIHNRGYETFIFRQNENEWQVIHTHSSTRPVKTETETPEHEH